MRKKGITAVVAVTLMVGTVLVATRAWTQQQALPPPQARAPHDAVMDAQTPREVPVTRPEQRKSEHDRSEPLSAANAEPSSTAFVEQPDQAGSSVLIFTAFMPAL